MTDIQKKIASLAEERRRILSMSPKKTMDAIIESPDGLAIVHSMADQDFHLLVNEIGPEDALELLSLASNRQWEHILDIEGWDREAIVGKPVLKWFALLMQADEERFFSWITTEKINFLELFLNYHIQSGIRVHDQEPSEIGDDFFTFDDVHYVRFVKKDIPGSVTEDNDVAFRDDMLFKLLRRLAKREPRTFQSLLFYSDSVLPAEAEEEAYRLRNVRLAEKGLLPFEEAIGIYQPAQKNRPLPEKPTATTIVDTSVPVPLAPTGLLARETVFSRALTLIDSVETLVELQAEFAALCNRLAVADRLVIKEKQDLTNIVKKACGYLHIGFSELTGQRLPDPAKTASLMKTHYLADIFRTGYSRVVTLKTRADKWYRDSWCRKKDLPVSFWGESRQGILAGLLVKRPLFFDIGQGGLIREFETLDDIEIAETTLDRIMALDTLLSVTDIDPGPVSQEVLTFNNMVLTLWARHQLGLPEIVDFISIKTFRPFFEELMGDITGQPDAAIGDDMKASFLRWLAGRTGHDPVNIVQSAGGIFEGLFTDIVEEYGPVSSADLDPRHIHLFLVS